MTTNCQNEQVAQPKFEFGEETERLLVNLDRSLAWLRRDRSGEAVIGELQAVVDELRETMGRLYS
jgi:uncharacterized protein (DUF3820 family)